VFLQEEGDPDSTNSGGWGGGVFRKGEEEKRGGSGSIDRKVYHIKERADLKEGGSVTARGKGDPS